MWRRTSAGGIAWAAPRCRDIAHNCITLRASPKGDAREVVRAPREELGNAIRAGNFRAFNSEFWGPSRDRTGAVSAGPKAASRRARLGSAKHRQARRRRAHARIPTPTAPSRAAPGAGTIDCISNSGRNSAARCSLWLPRRAPPRFDPVSSARPDGPSGVPANNAVFPCAVPSATSSVAHVPGSGRLTENSATALSPVREQATGQLGGLRSPAPADDALIGI